MEVSTQWCNDTSSHLFGYILRCEGKVVARCDDESDYRETVNELIKQGYVVKGING